jgi:NMD protein affecting ribosome stability and mRNA decay
MTSENKTEGAKAPDGRQWTTCFVRFPNSSAEQEVTVKHCEEHIKEMRRLGWIDRISGLENAIVVRLESEIKEVLEWEAKGLAYRIKHEKSPLLRKSA